LKRLSFKLFVFILSFSFLLTSCNIDLYAGKRPADFGKAKWICDTPVAWFSVDENATDEAKGEIIINDNNEWECPQCHNKDRSSLTVTRRTCGYLGENFWNTGKTKEIRERVLHL